MSCNHDITINNHCHECERAKNIDAFTAFGLIVATILALWFFGWGALKFVIWPWLFLAILWIAKYFIDKEEKKKKEQEEKEKQKNEKKETEK
jgi:hypothetical protein